MNCLDIKLPGSDDQEYSLNSFNGQKVVLYFYPKDNTSGWTVEAKDFNEARLAFLDKGYLIVGVSKDSIKSHKNFIKKAELEILLLSDVNKELGECFQVIKEKSMYGKKYLGVERSTFVLDETGQVVKEWRNVKVPGHVAEVLEFVQGLK